VDINRGPITPRNTTSGGSSSSIIGTPAPALYLEDPWVGDEGFLIPGPPGTPGATGAPGQVILIEAEPEEPLMIPGPPGVSSISSLSNLVGIFIEPPEPPDDLPMTPAAPGGSAMGVSLNTDAATLLTLIGQQLGLQIQAGNKVLAGPIYGLTDRAPHNMTTDSLPAPLVALASSEWTGLQAFQAFDGLISAGHYWLTNSTTTGWIQIYLGPGNFYVITSYAIQVNTVPEPNRAPKNFNLQGSIDGTTWNTLDTQAGQTSWGSGEKRTFTCAIANTAYCYFRLNITLNNGDANFCGIAELYLYQGAAIPTFRSLLVADLPQGQILGVQPVGEVIDPSEDLPLMPPWKAPGRTLPFFLAAGTSSPITLLDGPALRFTLATGTASNIGITA
jgi:hypothetical protein